MSVSVLLKFRFTSLAVKIPPWVMLMVFQYRGMLMVSWWVRLNSVIVVVPFKLRVTLTVKRPLLWVVMVFHVFGTGSFLILEGKYNLFMTVLLT